MLSISDLTVHYGRTPAVQSISLHVDVGEIVSLVGPNGAGKSTTLSAIMGLVEATSGSVAFEGTPLLGEPPEKIVRRGLALVPEGRHIFSTLSVAENLQLGMTVRQKGSNGADLEDVLRRFPILQTYYRSSAANLSGGEQQQLAIARALLARPRLLLLDEPSLGLAPIVVDLVFESLAELRASGVTILLVEQNAARAVELADRSYVLRAGRVALAGSSRELSQTVELETAYLGI